MQAKKILISDTVHPVLIDGLIKKGFLVDYYPDIKPDETKKILAAYSGIIINTKTKMNRAMLESGSKLEFIGRLGSGLDIIDLAFAKEQDISVFSAPEGNRNAVAEHALGMLLSLLNNLNRADKEVRQKEWNREENRGRELAGLVVGIIGYGHTGSCFAEKLSGMRVKVLAYDKYKEHFADNIRYVEECSLEELKKDADVISFHLPLTGETEHFVNREFISTCKDGIIIMNTSRGKIIETTVLIEEIHSGKVAGACLDVFENEKPQTFTKNEQKIYDDLYKLDNVILSPHIAGWTFESIRRIAEVLLSRINEKYKS
jgi:D-3-phosphoglycerate dehydrogenase